MQAGRELDALVAEKVMGVAWDESRCRVCGWPLHKGPSPFSLVERGRGAVVGCVADSCSMRPAPPRRADEPAPYSTDIAAAWLVVDAMLKCGFWLHALENQWENLWRCSFETKAPKPEQGVRHYADMAPTAPHAICLAALGASKV